MANNTLTNISSGIYTDEIDLTTAVQAVGTFAGAAIVLSEYGPAFEIVNSSTMSERIAVMGNLNPKYPASYFANAFLQQANNYKEIRILGLEGYTDDPSLDSHSTGLSFVILYDIPGETPQPASPGVSPLIAGTQAVAAVIKPRRTTFTGLAAVASVIVAPITGAATPTDSLFLMTINFTNATSMTVTGSLRPGSANYLPNIFGTDPMDGTILQGQVSPLWVEFIIPSELCHPSSDSITTPGQNPLDSFHPLAYYYPTNDSPQQTLNLVAGNMTVNIDFTYPTFVITAASATTPIVVTATGTAPVNYVNGAKIDIVGVVGNVAANGTYYIGGFVQNVGSFNFSLYHDAALTLPVASSGTYISGGTVQIAYIPTWERQVMDFSNIPYQTPVTPWFVSDVDADGNVQNLFRFWSISDGRSDNFQLKVQILNIDPQANSGNGSFDVAIREFSDTEDFGKTVLEYYTGVTMDPKSTKYIERVIGDGENFPINSQYMFIEINSTQPVPPSSLPYGCQGYQNVQGVEMPDVVWTTEYNQSKSISKQTLGLANNSINAFHVYTYVQDGASLTGPAAPDQLAFKNVESTSGATGRGFHMNPQGLSQFTGLGAIVAQNFDLVGEDNYLDSSNNPVPAATLITLMNYVVGFAGGFDGFNEYHTRTWNDTSSKDYQALAMAIDIFNDPESLQADFSVVTTPDIDMVNYPDATQAVLDMVTSRGDALYIFDFSYDANADPQVAKDTLRFSNMLSSYGAIYFPWCQISDSINNINIFLPPSLVAIQTVASVAVNQEVWQPPAGSLRTVTSDIVRTRRRMRLADRNILKSASINPITLFPGTGFEITEERTTQPTFSALSFIHNRLLLGYAKKAIQQTLRPLLFQLQASGGTSLSQAFINAVTPIFTRIKKLTGVADFSVSVIPQNDPTLLRGQITITPLYPVEQILVDFVLEDSGVTFSTPTQG